MTDPRVRRLAEVLVDYSTEVKEGEVVQIYAYEEAKPAVLEVYRKVLERKPKEVLFDLRFNDLDEVLFKTSDDEQLAKFPSLEMQLIENTDVWIGIRSYSNTKALSGIDPKRISLRRRTINPIDNYRVEKTRWVLTVYPTQAVAQDAEMSLAEFEDFYFKSIDVDWRALSKEQEILKRFLEKGKEIRIVGEGTDIKMGIGGRKMISADGKVNMPDGELFTAPIENSVQGHITFTYPAIYAAGFSGGREVEGIELWFEDGRVVKAKAVKNEEFLLQMLDTDAGARHIGELGIGNNFAIDRFVKSILFDEKIGGSVHLALGRAYRETGGTNDSAIHWDIIKDLRRGGEIYLDGELIQKDGKWVYKK